MAKSEVQISHLVEGSLSCELFLPSPRIALVRSCSQEPVVEFELNPSNVGRGHLKKGVKRNHSATYLPLILCVETKR